LVYFLRLPNYRKTFYLLYWRRNSRWYTWYIQSCIKTAVEYYIYSLSICKWVEKNGITYNISKSF
jgi:hypothetical protein